jgi:phage terminase large subunit-like protein
MGRRWGKTVLGGTTSVACAARGAKVAWIVPTYKNGRPLWRWAENVVAPLKRSGQVSVNRAERIIEFKNAGFLGIYSMDGEDSIRGESFHLAVVDEAARISETAWTDAIMPTLADFGGKAFLISTPKGRNWFWYEWLRGQEGNGEIHSWQAPTSDNPNPRIKRASELARERVPERTYQQEWLAEFVEDGSVFSRVSETATSKLQNEPISGHQYVIGVDWGKLEDFTCIAVIDIQEQALIHLERFNQIDYTLQMGRLRALYDRFEPITLIAESNAMGEPIIEQLRRQNIPVQPFVTTNASKAAIIEGLSLAFERDIIKILNNPVLIGELQAYETERLPSGLLRYSAPDGMHDDTVIALAIAWHAAQMRSGIHV